MTCDHPIGFTLHRLVGTQIVAVCPICHTTLVECGEVAREIQRQFAELTHTLGPITTSLRYLP